MNTGTVVTIAVVALIVVVLLLLIRAAQSGRRTPRLRPLSPEGRDHYLSEWDRVETKFLDSPEQAVREADTLVMAMLRERGHPLSERQLPVEVQKAHRLAYQSRDKTEGMRQAMLQFRSVMERMVGPETSRPAETRREMA